MASLYYIWAPKMYAWIIAVLISCLLGSIQAFAWNKPSTVSGYENFHKPINPCLTQFKNIEKQHAIPDGLLMAISMIESGKNIADHGVQIEPWPWTINVEGEGYFFASKNDAIKATEEFIKQGKQSIDVGCMQVNLKWHPDAFRSLKDAFDPAQNIRYGAKFLRELHLKKGNWDDAVAHYHSADPQRHQVYAEKVLRQWDKIKSGGSKQLSQHASSSATSSFIGISKNRPVNTKDINAQLRSQDGWKNFYKPLPQSQHATKRPSSQLVGHSEVVTQSHGTAGSGQPTVFSPELYQPPIRFIGLSPASGKNQPSSHAQNVTDVKNLVFIPLQR